MNLSSSAIKDGQPIPRKFTGEGVNISPSLQWDNVPPETKQFVLTCVDENAPGPEPWVHWIVYEIPASERSLPENVTTYKSLSSPAGAMQGCNSFSRGNIYGYQGPMPHAGTGVHHYVFTIHALDKELDLEPGLHMRTVLSAMEDHVIDTGKLTGTYVR